MPQRDFPRLDPASRRKTKVPVAHFAPRSAELGFFGDLGSLRTLLALLHVFFSPFQLQPRAPGTIFLAKTAFFGFSFFSLTLKARQGGCFFFQRTTEFPHLRRFCFTKPTRRELFHQFLHQTPSRNVQGRQRLSWSQREKGKTMEKTPVSRRFCVVLVFPFPVSARFQVKICTDPSA